MDRKGIFDIKENRIPELKAGDEEWIIEHGGSEKRDLRMILHNGGPRKASLLTYFWSPFQHKLKWLTDSSKKKKKKWGAITRIFWWHLIDLKNDFVQMLGFLKINYLKCLKIAVWNVCLIALPAEYQRN